MGLALHLSLYVFLTTPFSENADECRIIGVLWVAYHMRQLNIPYASANKTVSNKVYGVWSKNRIKIEHGR